MASSIFIASLKANGEFMAKRDSKKMKYLHDLYRKGMITIHEMTEAAKETTAWIGKEIG